MSDISLTLELLISIAEKAGSAILDIYNSSDFNVTEKDDNSPLTAADLISHSIIYEGLASNFPDIPILSEEGKNTSYEARKYWKRFWLVDPLDGTKEFIKRNGEFTVNIALIENEKPVLGVIHVPVFNETYYGAAGVGAFKKNIDGMIEKISVSSVDFNSGLNVVQSRSHSGEEENEFYSKYKIKDRLSKGSSLKICLVAEGRADLYFRGGPTMEWDTAAGHAVLLAAGGVFVTKTKSEFLYNKESLKNNGFIAASSMNLI